MSDTKNTKFLKGLLMVAVCLALAMLTIWATRPDGHPHIHTPENTTKYRIAEMESAIEIFHTKMGRYPSAEKGLLELVVPPEDETEAAKWVKLLDKIPIDTWGTELQYELIDGSDGPTFRVFSYGPDKIPGTKDDIMLWSPTK